MGNRIIIEVNGQSLHLVLRKTAKEWSELYGSDQECWDIALEELLDGTMEVNEDIWYWFINGRCYETTEEAE